MKIVDLKEEHPAIYELATKRCDAGYGENDYIKTAFHWAKTPEGSSFWGAIDDGNFQAFYDRYPEHAKYPIKFSIGEASPEAQKEFEANNPGMTFPDEPKAGDMVEATNTSFLTFLTTGRFTGGKSSAEAFILETRTGYEVYKYIRLPQKSEVESKVKSIIEEYKDGHGFNCPHATRTHFDLETVEMIAIEICKWGQQNPTKI